MVLDIFFVCLFRICPVTLELENWPRFVWNWLQIFHVCILTLLLAEIPGRRRPAAWLTLRWLALPGLPDPQQDPVTLPTTGWKLLRCRPSQVQGRWMSTSLLNSDANNWLSLTSTGLLCIQLTSCIICFVDSWFIRHYSDDAFCFSWWCLALTTNMYDVWLNLQVQLWSCKWLPSPRQVWMGEARLIDSEAKRAAAWNSPPLPPPPQCRGRGAYRCVSFVSVVKT